ncbi:ATP-dependent helicase [Kallotenue papyrolyticum]|uniref:ATP-dependent helicase n=1 Tax=Kallotenue papyrolyticum TaxID=1325125 RepID=UPI00047866BF|nr:ATP-dependent helicase [Kallotenue papyrolyticum]
MLTLNALQIAAARAPLEPPTKIIAGAGTGKTETLAARYVACVQQGIPPERILLLTFTEDAAAEMRARVTVRLREAGLDLPPHALLHPWISTFHGFALRLLQRYGFEVGLPPTPRLLNDDEQREIQQALREELETRLRLPDGYDPLAHTVYRWENDEVWKRALAIFSALRRGGGTPAELAPHPALAEHQQRVCAAQRAQLVPLIGYCWQTYVRQLQQRGQLDFDELLRAATRLLQAVPAIRTRFDIVMVDEFQDTNRPQFELLRALAPALQRVTVVGDPRQAIYGWNAARAELIVAFPFRAPPEAPGQEYTLSQNYRSHPAIIEVANLALSGSELSRFAPLEPASTGALQTPPADDAVVSLHLLPTLDDEARFIAAQIARLHAQGWPYAAMAVLQRARSEQARLLAALRDHNIPYVVRGGSGFYLHHLVRLTAALLRLIADPTDRAAWAHVLESPLIGLPAPLIAACAPFDAWLDAPEALPPDLPQREAIGLRLSNVHVLLTAARQRWGVLAPADYLDWLWQAGGIWHSAAQSGDPTAGLVLRQLLREADAYAAAHPADGIAGFAVLLEQRIATQPRVPLPAPPSADAVEVVTVHQAKGREWPVVFVWNTALPGKRSGEVEHVLWDEHWQLVITPDDARRHPPLEALRHDFRRRRRNEERAIWYVALTRARERLYVTHSGCALRDGTFADAQAGPARTTDGQPGGDAAHVHFFHELWHQLHARPGAIVCRDETSAAPPATR